MLLFGSCEYAFKEVQPNNNVPPVISFSGDIQPIFSATCTGCHNASHPYLDLREGLAYDQLWTTGANAPYVDTTNAASSLLYQKISTGSMSGYPGSSDKETILEWINQGAQNN